MANTATKVYNSTTKKYDIKVNGNTVYSLANSSQAATITDRLNRIFGDTNRDLDFITPSYTGSSYVVCCPKVRRNAGQKTYLKDGSSIAMKLYENTIWNDDTSNNANQTAILTIPSGTVAPWYEAIKIANKIRDYVKGNFNPLHGEQYIYRLQDPTNISTSVEKTLYTKADCNMFGEICQGVVNNDKYECTHDYYKGAVERISGAQTANNEVFHPMDLIAAMSTSDYNKYNRKYVKVSYGSKSIVVRVVTIMPSSASGIELSFAAWQALGYPPCNAGNVTIALMAEP